MTSRSFAPPTEGRGRGGAPRVSVITIFLNEERFLGDAIESVLAQTYPEWELLLCDDGSTDGSTGIARGYVEAHPDRIRYLEHPAHRNRGMSATRNLGLAHARGEYVALLDADDVMLPEKLGRQVALLDEYRDVAMVYGPSLWWVSWASSDASDDFPIDLGVPAPAKLAGQLVLKRILRGRANPLSTCSVLMRRSAVTGAGGFEDRFKGLFEDQAFFSKMLLDHDVLVVPEVLDLYRQHPDSCCAVAGRADTAGAAPLLAARREYVGWLREHLRDRVVDPGMRWAVFREDVLHRVPSIARRVIDARDTARIFRGRMVERLFAISRRVLPRRVRSTIWRFMRRGALAPPEGG